MVELQKGELVTVLGKPSDQTIATRYWVRDAFRRGWLMDRFWPKWSEYDKEKQQWETPAYVLTTA